MVWLRCHGARETTHRCTPVKSQPIPNNPHLHHSVEPSLGPELQSFYQVEALKLDLPTPLAARGLPVPGKSLYLTTKTTGLTRGSQETVRAVLRTAAGTGASTQVALDSAHSCPPGTSTRGRPSAPRTGCLLHPVLPGGGRSPFSPLSRQDNGIWHKRGSIPLLPKVSREKSPAISS